MFQLPQFVWVLRSSVWDIFINFLLIDATDRNKISSDQKRFFIALSLYPLSFFANTPFKKILSFQLMSSFCGIYTGFETVTQIHVNVNFQAFTHLSNKQDLLIR